MSSTQTVLEIRRRLIRKAETAEREMATDTGLLVSIDAARMVAYSDAADVCDRVLAGVDEPEEGDSGAR